MSSDNGKLIISLEDISQLLFNCLYSIYLDASSFLKPLQPLESDLINPLGSVRRMCADKTCVLNII